jgi:hypothetical protein
MKRDARSPGSVGIVREGDIQAARVGGGAKVLAAKTLTNVISHADGAHRVDVIEAQTNAENIIVATVDTQALAHTEILKRLKFLREYWSLKDR